MLMWTERDTCDEEAKFDAVTRGLRGKALTGSDIVTEIMGRREECCTIVRDEAGTTGKHLVTGTFTAGDVTLPGPCESADGTARQPILQLSPLPILEKSLIPAASTCS